MEDLTSNKSKRLDRTKKKKKKKRIFSSFGDARALAIKGLGTSKELDVTCGWD